MLHHLDAEGRARAVAMLRELPRASVLLTTQAHSDVAGLFDTVDYVVKRDGCSAVVTE